MNGVCYLTVTLHGLARSRKGPSAATKGSAAPISQRSPVEMLNRNAIQINSFETANIDGGYSIALWIRAFAVWVNAASPAKAVFDDVLVERVCADVVFCR